jgi:hypothetical protein
MRLDPLPIPSSRHHIISGASSITLFLGSPAPTLPPTFILIAPIIFVFATGGLIGDLGNNIGEEIQHLILGHGMFQM